ncbi:MAG: peptidoglycan editing factor PgeF [Nitrospirota bacterium]
MLDAGWELKEIKSYLGMPVFDQTGLVLHGVTTKIIGDFAANNQSKESIEKLSELIGINPEKMVFCNQIHGGDNIYCIQEDKIKQNPIPQTDGLITNIHGICLMIKVADCVSIFILDSKNKVISLIHAGWRGMMECIVQKAVSKMSAVYNSKPKDLLVGFGPSIGGCCYKVGPEVISQLKRLASLKFAYGDAYLDEDCLVKDLIRNGCLDLQQANKKQLIESGVLEKNIVLNQYCTYHHNDLFFSHRRGETGRMIAFLQLKK